MALANILRSDRSGICSSPDIVQLSIRITTQCHMDMEQQIREEDLNALRSAWDIALAKIIHRYEADRAWRSIV